MIDNEDEFEDTKAYFDERMPDLVKILSLYDGKQPIFENYGIEAAIDELYDRNVKLPSGGELVIDQTEALVAVDVNSSKSTKEDDHESTVYKTNLEAADEIARQLRLRDLGGIVVIDFIDMAARKHVREVEKRLKDAMRSDKARVKTGRIGDNGTLELTRQRLRQAHRLISHVNCPHCQGTGLVRDVEGRAISALRKIYNLLAKSRKRLARLNVRMPLDVANFLNNHKRQELLDIYNEEGILVCIDGAPGLFGEEVEIEKEGRGQAGMKAARASKASEQKKGRRQRNNNADLTQTSGPPPSIGTAPSFIEGEEGEQAWLSQEDAPEEIPESKETEEKLPQHFEDPLMEALFGDAPEMELSDALTRPDPIVETKSNEDEDGADGQSTGNKKKSRRKRRSRRDRNKKKTAAEQDNGEEPNPNEGDDEAQTENEPREVMETSESVEVKSEVETTQEPAPVLPSEESAPNEEQTTLTQETPPVS